ncbi:MAG TPA: dihydrofolate reductase [Edaphocola sp.]|nr:dihydrofolate reductase [Edaphocola sp.]
MIILAAAFGNNFELGQNGANPLWNLPDEYNRFIKSIEHHPIIMGRKSYDVVENPIDNCLNIVVTNKEDYNGNGAVVVNSLEKAFEVAKGDKDIYVIGGGVIFEEVIKFADRMELSRIEGTFPTADAFFPRFSEEEWQLISAERHEKDENHKYAFTFQVWERRAINEN